MRNEEKRCQENKMHLRALDGGKSNLPLATKTNLQIENIHSGIPRWLEIFTWLDTPIKPVKKIKPDILCLHVVWG